MTDNKTIYAQSRDIKSRTYLEYRKDMKQKAIMELEILDWLKSHFSSCSVEKYGGDKHIWFLRKGGITREPDFILKKSFNDKSFLELQYAKTQGKYYDFKISKIAPKDRKKKKRIPIKNTKILYIVKDSGYYTFLEPYYIFNHSKETVAAAWGNAPVYRINQEKMNFQYNKEVHEKCRIVEQKIKILNFQHQAINIEKERLSNILQQVVDEEKLVKITPKTLNSFFDVCFILDHINKIPKQANLWLIYLLSFVDNKNKLSSYDLFKLTYSLDFLYSKIELSQHEIQKIISKIQIIFTSINNFSQSDGFYSSNKSISPIEDTRYCLFIINILEDLIQDLIYYYKDICSIDLKPILNIYQNINDIDKVYHFIKDEQYNPLNQTNFYFFDF